MAQNIDFQDLLYRLQEEAQEVVRIVQEKGGKHFQQSFLIAGGALAFAYLLVYRTTSSKLEDLNAAIFGEHQKADASSSYADLRSRLLGLYSKMPRPEKKGGWLFDKILATASSQGIVLDKIGTQAESDMKDYLLLSIGVTAHVTYPQMGKWLETIENQTPQLFVTNLQFSKEEKGKLGTHAVSLEITTVMPKAMRPL